MEPHQEAAFERHLKSLPKTELDTHKAHANAADSEKHPSYAHAAKLAAAVLGIPVTLGLGWKAIKVIKRT